MPTSPLHRVLFVCMGNICRSPLAEGVFRHKVQEAGLTHLVDIDSAGTHFYHVGAPPDPRSCQVAQEHGYSLLGQTARQFRPEDFADYTHILVMDKRNLRDVAGYLPDGQTVLPPHVALFLERFAPELPEIEVPDPYYGGADGFEYVLRLVEAASDGLLSQIQQNNPAQQHVS